MKYYILSTFLFLSAATLLRAQEKVDMQVMQQIKDEEKNNSQVEMIAHNITDVCGPPKVDQRQ